MVSMTEMNHCRVFLLAFSLLAAASSQDLVFLTNSGESLYTFRYSEYAVDMDGMVISGSLPPDLFNVTCLLDGQPSTDITYSLADGGGDMNTTYSSGDRNGVMFQVDPTTGALFLQDGMELDYEAETDIQFNVTCSSPSAARDATAEVFFMVLPVNEYPPVLSTRTLYARVGEDIAIGTVLVSTRSDVGAVATFSATDEDNGADGELEYTLTFNKSLTLFSFNRTFGTLTVTQTLDVDDTQFGFKVFTIRLTACDIVPAVPSCPNVEVSLVITSANDNQPVFAQDVYQATISEHVPSGFFIVNVSCTDADIGAGHFESVTSSLDLFNVTLQPSEQIVLLNGMLDFETAQTHNVTLTCFDSSGSVARALLLVTVEPVNDNRPQFTKNEYSFMISPLLTTGKEIGSVEAVDRDQVVGNNLTFSMMENDDFEIQNDGTIIFIGLVGVAEGEVIDFTVEVSDGEFSDNTTVVITGEFSDSSMVMITGELSNVVNIGTVDDTPINKTDALINKASSVQIAPLVIYIGMGTFLLVLLAIQFCCIGYCCIRSIKRHRPHKDRKTNTSKVEVYRTTDKPLPPPSLPPPPPYVPPSSPSPILQDLENTTCNPVPASDIARLREMFQRVREREGEMEAAVWHWLHYQSS